MPDYGSALENVEITEAERLQLRVNQLEAQIAWMSERESATLVNYRPTPDRNNVTKLVADLQSIDLAQEERKWAQIEADELAASAAKYAEERQRAIDQCMCPPCVEAREAL